MVLGEVEEQEKHRLRGQALMNQPQTHDLHSANAPDAVADHWFQYLVVVDFEATCDEGRNPKITRSNQEIIEFPWYYTHAQHSLNFNQIEWM